MGEYSNVDYQPILKDNIILHIIIYSSYTRTMYSWSRFTTVTNELKVHLQYHVNEIQTYYSCHS